MGQAKKTSQEMIEFFQNLFTQGWDTALERLQISDEEARQILTENGLSPTQVSLIAENQLFRNGLQVSTDIPLAPELQDVINSTANITRRLTDDIINQQGQTNITRQLADRTTEILQGQTGPQQANEQLGYRLLESGGSTAGLDTITDRSTDILNSFGRVGMNEASDTLRTAKDIVATGGVTPKTEEIFAMGSKLVQDGGFTPQLTQVFDQMLAALNGGLGNTPEFDQTFQALQQIVASEGAAGAGILPVNEFLGYVQADAGRRSAQIAEAAAVEATRRGLSPGAASLADGGVSADAAEAMLQNEGLATAAAVSENQQLRATATSNALSNMVALVNGQRNDPRLAMYAGVLGDVISASTQNIATGAQMTLGAGELENQRLAVALQSVRDITALFMQREANANNALLGAEQQRTQNQALGSDILNREMMTRLTAGNLMVDVNNSNVNNWLSAAQTGINANIANANTFLQNQNQQMNFNLGSFTAETNAFLASLGLSADVAQQGQNNRLNAMQISQGGALPFLNIAGNAMGGISKGYQNLIDLQSRPGFFDILGQNFAASVGQGAGALVTGGVGNVFGGAAGRFELPSVTSPAPVAATPQGSAPVIFDPMVNAPPTYTDVFGNTSGLNWGF